MDDPVLGLPPECLLGWWEKEIVRKTILPNETPCMGCFRRTGCPARVDLSLRTALRLMEEPVPSYMKCARCKSEMVEWKISTQSRVWVCSGKLEGSDIPCRWTMAAGAFFP